MQSVKNTILIVYPHWPPSNLAGVHRVRLIANGLIHHGWHPIILTVDERDHDEILDPGLTKLVSNSIEVIKVRAKAPLRVFGKRLIGDIGLRAWHSLKSESKELLKQRQIDFLLYSIPSWYPCLQGRKLSKVYKVPFAIDFQDPWIYEVAPNTSVLSKEYWTSLMARILEPRALHGVSFISAINRDYMQGPMTRYSHLKNKPNLSIQLGFDPADHSIEIPDLENPWTPNQQSITYAGTYWPQGEPVFDMFLSAVQQIHENGNWRRNLIITFIGTQNSKLQSITDKSNELGISHIISEKPERIPYLYAQQFLRNSKAVLAFGSTASHYSPSKVFQLLFTNKPIIACFNPQSTIFPILQSCAANQGLCEYHRNDQPRTVQGIRDVLESLIREELPWNIDISAIEPHSASNAAATLAHAMNQCMAP